MTEARTVDGTCVNRGWLPSKNLIEAARLLGVSMVGESAGEVIHGAAMGLHFRAKLQDFVNLLHVYPSMAEALKLVAFSRFKDPRKLSCCVE